MTTKVDDVSRLPVRRLAPCELGAIQALAYGRDWFYPDSTWELLFDIGEIHGVFDEEGDLLTTATLVRFGLQMASVGMVLTDPRVEGRGLGRRVMQRVLDRTGDASVILYATARGRPLYEKLGFVPLAESTIYKGVPEPADAQPPRSRPVTPDDLPGMLALDGAALGADRSDMVVQLFDYAHELRVIERGNQVVAYGGSWRAVDSLVLGPVVAVDGADAVALLDDLVRRARGSLRLEAHGDRPHIHGWAAERGLVQQGFLSAMAIGPPLPGDWGLWHAPLSLATG
jgi:GNAT superfamily N-acetyltransferase